VIQAAAFVSAVYACLMTRLRMERSSRPGISYAPMSAMDLERQANLNKIYNCNDTKCINMLRMRRAPFFNLCNLFRERNLLRDTTRLWVMGKMSCSLMLPPGNQTHHQIFQPRK
jgi:hypothetical protein